MPAAQTRRQPERPADAWFDREDTRALAVDVQRAAVPELTRVFGHTGLYLRPSRELPPVLSGNMLASVASLYRRGDHLEGDLACADGRLPIVAGSLSLAYALFVLETSPSPQALISELARTLKPEGVLLLLTLNPWSPMRLRWAFRGLNAPAPVELQGWITGNGLELQRRLGIGPRWSRPSPGEATLPRDGGLAWGRAATLWVARRRDPGLTPLRPASAVLRMRPGMSAG